MAKIKLADIFKGEHPITQLFGANPDIYGQWGLKGHEGIDFGMPNGTELLCPFSEAIVVRADDYGNYGRHIVLWDVSQLAAVWFCHCQTLLKKVGDVVNKGTVVALSNNTGYSTGPHLHFGVCRTDKNGVRLNQGNGYIGFLNPMVEVEWDLGSQPADNSGNEYKEKYDICMKDRNKFWKERDEAREEIKKLEKTLERKESEIADWKIKAEAAERLAVEEKKRFKNFRADCAEPLGWDVPQDEVKIISKIKELVDCQDAKEAEIKKLKEEKDNIEKEWEDKLDNKETVLIQSQEAYEACNKINKRLKQQLSNATSNSNSNGGNQAGKESGEVSNFMKNALWEAVKEPLRLLVLAVLPFAISYFAGLNYAWAGAATVVLRFVDKWMHNYGKETDNKVLVTGLTRF